MFANLAQKRFLNAVKRKSERAITTTKPKCENGEGAKKKERETGGKEKCEEESKAFERNHARRERE